MNILMSESHNIIEGVDKLTNKREINKNTRLFYELGTYTERNSSGWVKESWRRSGYYKEILNPLLFKKHDKALNNAEYIRHHNFMILPLTNNEK